MFKLRKRENHPCRTPSHLSRVKHSFDWWPFHAHLCVEGGLGQIAKLLAARAEMRTPCAFRTGERVDVKVGNGLEVTVKEQQGWVRHETGEGEMERCDTYKKHPFFITLSHARVCTRMKMCGCAQTDCATEKCACNK